MKLREKLMRMLRKSGYKRTLKIDRDLEHKNVYMYTKRVSDIDVSAMIFNLLYDYDCYTVKLAFLSPGKHYNMIWVDKPEVLEEALSILKSVNEFIEEENRNMKKRKQIKKELKSKPETETGVKKYNRLKKMSKERKIEKAKVEAIKC